MLSGAITVRKLKYILQIHDQTGISTITDAEVIMILYLMMVVTCLLLQQVGYVTEFIARVDNSATKQNPRLRLQTTPSSSGVGTSKGKVINALTGLPVRGHP